MKILIRNQQRQRRLNKARIIRVARQILFMMGNSDAELSILLVGDRRMLKLNSQFRGVKKSTDVLSFDAGIPVRVNGRNILGDVVINVSKAEAQARMSGISFYDELNRLLVHGILHLLGYDHEVSRYKAIQMTKKEKEILNAIKKVY